MNLLSNGANAVSAQMRGYRSQAAQSLLNLLRPGETISDIGWEQLEQLPPWTLLKTNDLLKVTREIGLVVLAPYFKKSIDGTLLKTISSKVDVAFVRRLLSSEMVENNAVPGNSAVHVRQHPVKAIEQAGAAVLLSTIDNATLVGILARRFDGAHEMIDAQLATNLVKQTQALRTPSNTPVDSETKCRSSRMKKHAEGAMA